VFTLTFTVYSKKISYAEISSDDLIQLGSQAQNDWLSVVDMVKQILTETSIVITFGDVMYNSEPNSTIIWPPQYTCPLGKQISSSNNFLCGES